MSAVVRIKSGIELLAIWFKSPCKKGLKKTPCKPEKVLGKIPCEDKSILKLFSKKKTDQIKISKNNGTIHTEGVNLKWW